jgi:hypothetical protein
MPFIVKPALVIVAASPLFIMPVADQTKRVVDGNGTGATCVANMLAVQLSPAKEILYTIAAVEASSAYGERADAKLFCHSEKSILQKGVEQGNVHGGVQPQHVHAAPDPEALG